ncbi:MAG: hypothetical protein KDA58_11955 [Planctomycetaceae bacterium]|nr:hypothetical protein [Planctomycetaceae bacterium]
MPTPPSRILLISGTAPGEPGVGGVILRDLVRIVGPAQMHTCWLNPYRDKQPHYLPELSVSHHQRRYETGWKPIGGVGGDLAACAAAVALQRPLIQQAVREIQSQIDQFQPDLILTVLESAMAVQVIAALLPQIKVPLRTIVWDDVHTFCPAGRLDRWTERQVYDAFRKTLRHSEQIAVICENMQVAYQREYGVDSFVLRHGLDAATTDACERDPNVYRIGFAGSVTTPDCMREFIAALDSMNWRLDGKEICLRMLGARFQLGTLSRQWIEYFGWRDVTETRNLLSECDLLYLPQSFLPDLRHLSELSFPTKLSTYVAANVPILLHAPDYASLTEFWSRYDLGPRAELAAASVQESLTQGLTASLSDRELWLSNILSARRDALSPALFEQGVRRLLSSNLETGN